MLEVEMKFPVADFAPVERQLRAWGAKALAGREEVDHYLNAPDRDFAQTDEALRVRCVGEVNFVTYKGPKRDAQTKTRTEIEVPLGQGQETAQQFLQLLQHLGYRFVAAVRKQRTILGLERGGFAVEACLDEVEGVGTFVELEIQAAEESLDAARSALLETAAALGLARSERRSYLEMLLTAREGAP